MIKGMQTSLIDFFSYDDITLRKPQESDTNELVSLINEAYSYQDAAKGAPRTNVEHLITRMAETDFYVLEKDSRPVGCVYLEPHPDSLHFGLLMLAPKLRGTGVGKALIGAIIKYAKQHPYERIELDYMSLAPWLKKYYEQYGFKEIGEKVAWGSIDLIRMRLDLSITEK